MRHEPNPKLIGSTDVAALLGLHPFCTGYELWRRLVHGEEQNRDQFALRRMETGLLRQDQLAAWWLSDHDMALDAARVGPYLEHPFGRPWQRLSTDYVVPGPGGEDEGLEIKLTERIDDSWGEPGTDVIPEHYFVQVQVQAEVLKWRRIHVAVGWGLASARYFTVEANPALGAELVGEAERWWDEHVVHGHPPPLTEIESQRARWAALRARFAAPGFVEREATPREVELALQVKAHRVAAKSADDAGKVLELELRELLGDAGLVFWDGGPKKGSRVTCRPTKAGVSIDWKALAEAKGATQAEITEHSRPKEPSRPMRITVRGQETDE